MVIPPLLVLTVVFLGVAYAVTRWRDRRWLLVVAAVLPVIALLANLPVLIDDGSHPESPYTFIPTVVSVIGGLLASIAGIAAILRANPRLARPSALAAAVLGLVAAIASVAVYMGLEDSAAAARDVIVVAEAVEYPEAITAPAGGATFFLDNRDRFRHTFVIEGQDVKEELPGAASRRVEINLPAGSYRFICDVMGHEVMEGTLTVQ